MNLNGTPTNPGEMRTSITLKKRTATADAGGFMVPGWTTLGTVWAKWTNVHGAEVWTAQMAQAVQPATIWIRYRNDVDTSCAVFLGSTMYEIVSVDNVQQRSEYMELKVRRMAGG